MLRLAAVQPTPERQPSALLGAKVESSNPAQGTKLPKTKMGDLCLPGFCHFSGARPAPSGLPPAFLRFPLPRRDSSVAKGATQSAQLDEPLQVMPGAERSCVGSRGGASFWPPKSYRSHPSLRGARCYLRNPDRQSSEPGRLPLQQRAAPAPPAAAAAAVPGPTARTACSPGGSGAPEPGSPGPQPDCEPARERSLAAPRAATAIGEEEEPPPSFGHSTRARRRPRQSGSGYPGVGFNAGGGGGEGWAAFPLDAAGDTGFSRAPPKRRATKFPAPFGFKVQARSLPKPAPLPASAVAAAASPTLLRRPGQLYAKKKGGEGCSPPVFLLRLSELKETAEVGTILLDWYEALLEE